MVQWVMVSVASSVMRWSGDQDTPWPGYWWPGSWWLNIDHRHQSPAAPWACHQHLSHCHSLCPGHSESCLSGHPLSPLSARGQTWSPPRPLWPGRPNHLFWPDTKTVKYEKMWADTGLSVLSAILGPGALCTQHGDAETRQWRSDAPWSFHTLLSLIFQVWSLAFSIICPALVRI